MVKVRAALEAGTLGYLELIIDSNSQTGGGDAAFVAAWAEDYPNEFAHHAGDDTTSDDFFNYTSPSLGNGMPQGGLVGADYKWEVLGINEAIAAAAQK